MRGSEYFTATIAVILIVGSQALLDGSSSDCGCKCQNGRDGRDGRDGVSIQGPPGRDGSNGQDGRDCIDCKAGPKGDKGAPGAKGRDGAAGTAGARGPTGPKGNAGVKGAKGDAGARGVKGEKGDKGNNGVCDNKALITLQGKIVSLTKKMGEVQHDADLSKRTVDALKTKIANLEKEVKDLKSKQVTLGADHKIDQRLLPAGYSQFSVNDLQWHSLHMAAASACRATTAIFGETSVNRVLPRSTQKSCTDVCKASKYKVCDAEISISGTVNKVSSSKNEVAWFANHGCDGKGNYGFEPTAHSDQIVKNLGNSNFFSYCCCH